MDTEKELGGKGVRGQFNGLSSSTKEKEIKSLQPHKLHSLSFILFRLYASLPRDHFIFGNVASSELSAMRKKTMVSANFYKKN